MGLKTAILGAGPGGYVAAVRAAQLGADVTIVEDDNLGGTCLNWGCIPSKILKSAADRLEAIKHAGPFGVKADPNPEIDMAALAARKSSVIQAQRKGIAGLLKHHNVHHLKGRGTIQDAGLLAVEGQDGSRGEVVYDRLIIATG